MGDNGQGCWLWDSYDENFGNFNELFDFIKIYGISWCFMIS